MDVLKPEGIIHIAPDELIGLKNILNLMIDKIIERINMLLNQSLHLKKGG